MLLNNAHISISYVKAFFAVFLFFTSISLFANNNTEKKDITCPDDLEIDLGANQCGTVVSFDTLTWVSTEELIDTIFFPPSGSFFNIGNNTVTLATTTVDGELEVCTFSVIVNEFTPASINCYQEVDLMLNGSCSRNVQPSEFLNPNSVGCLANYQVIKLDNQGNILPPTIDADEVGQTFTFVVQHVSNGLQCSSLGTITGGAPPLISCPDDITVVCNTPLLPETTGMPDTIGCYQEFLLDYIDETALTLCPDSIGFQETRTWMATDPFGNKTSCEQIITAMRFNISMVEFPPDFDGTENEPLECVNGKTWQQVAITSVTGVPLFMGNPANTNPDCDITANYQDFPTKICGSTYDIARVWRIVNICNPLITVKDTQYIKVIDIEDPLFEVPDTIFASTSMDCFDSLYIPGAFNIHECSSFNTVIMSQWDTLYTNGGWSNVDLSTVGTYPIFYQLKDACNNSSFAFSIVEIKEGTLATCPPNDTIDCDYFFNVISPAIALEEYDTLASLGMPEFPGNCEFNVTETDSVSVDDCGNGVVVRTLTTDASNPEVCIQTVFVKHISNFEAIFPKDTTICVPPSMANLKTPQLLNFTCEDVSIDRVDDIIVDGPNGCYTIKRNWILTDVCNTNSTNNNDDITLGDRHLKDGGDGILEYTQTIIVNSTNGIVFPEGCEMPDLFLPANSCNLTVTVPTPAVSGCRNLDFDVFGELGLVMGIDVTIGVGSYNVAYTAEDDCGNTGVCLTEFTVSDTIGPIANCKSTLFVELAPSGNEPIVEVSSDDFDNGSIDNCSSNLSFHFDQGMSIYSLSFGCCDVGAHEATVWVTDEYGNQSTCEVFIFVQETNVGCDSCEPFVSGTIETETGIGIQNVDVSIESTSISSDILTGTDGTYFLNLITGDDVEITPSKNINHNNGVTTFDAVLMTRHILGVEFLSSPYKIIAADINNSGTVTTFDIVEMRKLILFIYDNFPNNNSWRFVPSDYVFPNPLNPWQEPFPESIMINNIVADMPAEDFIGIKIGDLNNSANPMN